MQNDDNEKPIEQGEEPIESEGEAAAIPERIDSPAESATPKIPDVDEISPPEEAPKALEEPPEKPPEEEVPAEAPSDELDEGEDRIRSFSRRFIRWTAGLLIVFGLGLLTGVFTLYRPAVQEADREINRLTADLASANETIVKLENQITDLEAEITRLEQFEEKNNQLLAEQKNLNLQIAVLNARLDISDARLALIQEDLPATRLFLNQTSNTLDVINSLLEPEHQDFIENLKQRLDLVMEEIDEDPSLAQTDLELLEAKLLELQESLFSQGP